MFNIFKSKGEEDAIPEWINEMNENRQRWFTFLDKLEARMQELGEAAVPDLKESFEQDEDNYKRTYHLMVSAIKGQFNQVREKVRDVKEEKVHNFFGYYSSQVSFDSPYRDMLYQYRTDCSEREDSFDKKYHHWISEIDRTGVEDLELKYREIINEYEAIKDKFTCRQCGSTLSIPKIFFISTYITCPHCQTQNTFSPGSQARNLEHLGRQLAEQRTAHLLKAYEDEVQKERDIYFQKHELRLSVNDYGNKKAEEDNKKIQDELEMQRQQVINNAPALYEKYLRAMFDEWHSIVPDLKEQNEKFYLRQLADFKSRNN